ncbi:MAG: 23S rRNA (adenine(2503)-C(2))-methyltransferase RlmN [Bacteroidales bacterium]|nr:23S rRNA (adenine(2503)-C(2))-methyltransferase RlmN [Bacteroidales bacterium]
MKPLIGLTLEQLRQVAAEAGLRPFAAKQMAAWLYHRRVTTIDEMTDLPKAGRQRLAELGYDVGRTAPLATAVSKDGTVKYLFEGAPRRRVEAVMIPDKERRTLCVSSQAGCRMGCAFCMTGQQGFHGHLSPAQIMNQILSVEESADLTNLVFMGMGEPLDNLDAVMTVIEILTAPWGLAWSPKRITVSTIGRLDMLRRLLDQTKVHVAISVHSPYSEQRGALMPVERAWPIAEVVKVLNRYDFSHQRRLSIEYIMWRGVNDDLRHADALARMLHGLDCRVNLIRFHAIPGFKGQPSREADMEAFRDRLNDKGITATIRASRGEDIMAACGMLAGAEERREREDRGTEDRGTEG